MLCKLTNDHLELHSQQLTDKNAQPSKWAEHITSMQLDYLILILGISKKSTTSRLGLCTLTTLLPYR